MGHYTELVCELIFLHNIASDLLIAVNPQKLLTSVISKRDVKIPKNIQMFKPK